MISDAEVRLASRGVAIRELGSQDHPGDLEGHLAEHPDVVGLLLLNPDPSGGAYVRAVVRPDAGSERRAWFAAWVEEKIDRFAEHGPEPDGWSRRQLDGGWMLWAEELDLPPL
ncbi:hypothetical protein [Blastococcus sp. SYSU D00820]